jgi:CheY-like chemotaxis protein
MAKRVLLVLDDATYARALGGALEHAGAQTMHVTDVDVASDLITEQPFDTVVIDLHLPRTSAIVLLHRMRTNPATRHIAGIALTRIDIPDVRDIACEVGFTACVSNSVPVDQLAALVMQGGV